MLKSGDLYHDVNMLYLPNYIFSNYVNLGFHCGLSKGFDFKFRVSFLSTLGLVLRLPLHLLAAISIEHNQLGSTMIMKGLRG
jgi:hypothetical protein